MGIGIELKEKSDRNSLRFASYNMMFGMYGREGVINAIEHLSFHGMKSSLLTRLFSRFSGKSVDIVNRCKADFICLNEVLGTIRKKEMIDKFRIEGYEYFAWGPAEHHDKPLDLGTLFVSKYPFEELNFSFPQEHHMGGGGGACAVYSKELNLVVLALHLGRNKTLQEKQIRAVSAFIKIQESWKRKVVVMGDFNLNVKELTSYKNFSILDLSSSNNLGTSPEIAEIKLFESEALDNIFYRGLKLKDSGRFKGFSDHLGVWAEFEK